MNTKTRQNNMNKVNHERKRSLELSFYISVNLRPVVKALEVLAVAITAKSAVFKNIIITVTKFVLECFSHLKL